VRMEGRCSWLTIMHVQWWVLVLPMLNLCVMLPELEYSTLWKWFLARRNNVIKKIASNFILFHIIMITMMICLSDIIYDSLIHFFKSGPFTFLVNNKEIYLCGNLFIFF
jgi:hypothetical protein